MSRRTLRAYVVTHHDGRRSAILMRRREGFFDSPPPSAYGETESAVLAEVEQKLAARIAEDTDQLDRYLWDETFQTRTVRVEIHPLSVIKKQPVVGKQRIPLRLTYAWSRMKSGAYRVMLPRFGWWLILEDLESGADALTQAVSSALLGAEPRWLYDFREEGEEVVREMRLDLLAKHEDAVDEEEPEALPVLSTVADELVDRAARRKLPPLVGDDPTVEAELGTLLGTPRPSTLLVGEPGVGKTAFVHRLAGVLLRRRREGGPPIRLWSTAADRIIAGMIYVGQWQERVLKLIDELSDTEDLLHLGRLPDLLVQQPGGSSIADLLGPAIRDGRITVIAECTESERVRARRRDATLVDSLHLVRVPEPSVARTLSLLSIYNERRGGPPIHPAGMKRLVRHLSTFRRDERQPGKGIRFLDWLARTARGRALLFPADVSALYAEHSGLPVELIGDEHAAPVAELARRLSAAVIGQDHACAVCARVLARFKAGLNPEDRPVGSMLFCGPTGVGKTELAKQLARTLFGREERMVRVDMSEYMVPGAATRLLAAGRGVRSLAEHVRREPLSLVLLDEIEKAHPEVFDVLLGVLGEGRLTDVHGRLVDFRMTVIVMTSNLGVSERATVGFDAADPTDYERSVRDHFRPELFNRIDHVVSFRALSPGDVARIVDLEIARAARRPGLVRRGLTLVLDDSARARLAELGWHRTRGARPLKRVIEERVMTPIAARLAARPSLRDARVRVVAEGSEAEKRLTAAERRLAVVV